MSWMRNINRLSKGIQISIPTDEQGMSGRECPNSECLGYFKIEFGTCLEGENLPCYCPYCGHNAGHDQFWTQSQIEYARSVALNEINEALRKDFQTWDRQLRRQTRGSFIKMSVDFQGRKHPIHYYTEDQLETEVVCELCTLHYAIYGVFGCCPDCGVHNSLQILTKNIELVAKQITLAENIEDNEELAGYLVADSLENAVSAFDGFGRETCRVHAAKAADPTQAENLSFQSLIRADSRLYRNFGFKLSDALASSDWDFVIRCFQKRHLLAHRMGVVDQQYLDATGDPNAVVGRKIIVSPDEVRTLANHIQKLGQFMIGHL